MSRIIQAVPRKYGNLVQHIDGRIGRIHFPGDSFPLTKDKVFVCWYREQKQPDENWAEFVGRCEPWPASYRVKIDQLKVLAYIHTR